MKKIIFCLIAIIIIAFYACKKDSQNPPTAPSNLTATSVTPTRIDLSWKDNSSNEKGFVIYRSVTDISHSWPPFDSLCTVSANTTSYSDVTVGANAHCLYKIKAKNDNGSSAFSNYDSAWAITAIQPINYNSSATYSTFTDTRDGKIYKTIQIGTQIWFAQNLDYATNNSSYYNGVGAYGPFYGRLYIHDDALLACPQGWHIPSQAEWMVLINYLGGDNVAGRALKESGTSHWKSPNDANNNSGFTALPFVLGDDEVLFHASDASSAFYSSGVRVVNDNATIMHGSYYVYGKLYYVRCIKD